MRSGHDSRKERVIVSVSRIGQDGWWQYDRFDTRSGVMEG